MTHFAFLRGVLVALALSSLVAVVVTATASAAPTPILLGNAGIYALLGGTGLTNTGITTVTGDVGSSATRSETGFAACPAADCVTLTGANHNDPDPNDAQTQSAKTDLLTAYNNAAGQAATAIPTELGGTTLVAGVYNSGTLGMTGTLTLDGANNADSIFIFQAGSTLITGGTANVQFIRGAQACNVFWQIGSSATLGAGSNFSGTLMALTNISLGNGVTVQGRLLALNAAVNLDHDTIIKPSSCTTQASIDAAATAAAAAAALATAQAAAAAQAAADAQAQADRAAAAAKAADAKTAADAAAKAAAAAAAAVQAAAVAAAAVEKAAADAAAAEVARAAVVKAVAAAKTAKAAATRARIAKANAVHLATARAIALKRNAVRAPKVRTGFTG
jgi:hypothetical protein